jgi:Bcr/CflA subfamily drug resistance transporter
MNMKLNTRSNWLNPLALFPFILVFYEVTNYLANDMYLPALPNIANDFKISAHYAQMTLTAWFLGTATLQLILGPISDRVGRRPVLLYGGIVFIVSTFMCAIASNINLLLLARFFQGFSVCAIGTAGYSSIHESFEQRKAIHILAIMGSITVLAPAFGPLVGAVILNWVSWRWIFGILVIWALIALFALYLWMPESNPKEKRFALNWHLIFKNYLSILRNPRFMLNTFIFCFNFLGIIVWIAAGPFLVIEKFKYSTFIFGIYQALVFGSLILSAQIVKYLIHKVNIDHLINIGIGISLTGSLIAFLLSIIYPHFLLGLILSLMVFTFGSSFSFSPSQRIAIDACPEPMGAKMAISSSLMSIFGVIGGLLVSATYTGTLLWVSTWLLIVSLAAGLIRFFEKKIAI